MRERFIFSQHWYCTNLFWQLFQKCLQISWPFDLRDCYKVDPDTGRYALTSAFEDRLRDINSWKMTEDFFAAFPELRGDIPISGSIPPLVSWTKEERAQCRMRAEAAKRSNHAGAQDDSRHSANVPSLNPTWTSASGGLGCLQVSHDLIFGTPSSHSLPSYSESEGL